MQWKSSLQGLPLYHGAQLAVDITLRSVLSASGLPRFNAAVVDSPVSGRAPENKERKYVEFLHGDRCRLVVAGRGYPGDWGQVGQEAMDFVAGLPVARAREATPLPPFRILGAEAQMVSHGDNFVRTRFATSLTAVNTLPRSGWGQSRFG